jgi:hypothetical protein
MKIKNISSQDLGISLEVNKQIKTVNVKPLQVMYCEDESQVNNRLRIYEKKKLISIKLMSEKPDHIENYKPFFESETYSSLAPAATIEIGPDDEMENTDIPAFEGSFEPDELISADTKTSEENPEDTAKKKRGRPKKPVSQNETPAEKKIRGRPKGSTKNKEV